MVYKDKKDLKYDEFYHLNLVDIQLIRG